MWVKTVISLDNITANDCKLCVLVLCVQSEATDTKYNLFVSSPEAVKSRTRQRKPQYIRDDNFVMPVGHIWVDCVTVIMVVE